MDVRSKQANSVPTFPGLVAYRNRRAQRRAADIARYLLAGVRIVNGAAGLVAPGFLIRQLGGDPASAPAKYAFRLFGIRTIFIGADLLLLTGHERSRAVRRAVVIHGIDTVTALTLAAQGRLPGRAAITIPAISFVNTVLSVVARKGSP